MLLEFNWGMGSGVSMETLYCLPPYAHEEGGVVCVYIKHAIRY